MRCVTEDPLGSIPESFRRRGSGELEVLAGISPLPGRIGQPSE